MTTEEPCDCEFVDVMGPGYPLMRMAMAHCPTHGHPWDCEGCWYCMCSSKFTRGGLFPGLNECELPRGHADLHSSYNGGFFWTDSDADPT
jgi:hypothetical protein